MLEFLFLGLTLGAWPWWPARLLLGGWLVLRLASRPPQIVVALAITSAGISLGWWRSTAVATAWQTARNQVAPLQTYEGWATLTDATDRRAAKTFVPLLLDEPRVLVRASVPRWISGQPGDRWKVSCLLSWPVAPAPGEFDYGTWLRRYGFTDTCLATIIARDSRPPPQSWALARFLAAGQEHFSAAISRLVPEPEASFLTGLLVGASGEMPVSLTDALRRTGTSHIVAVSGANVVIVSGAVLWIARFTLFRRRAAFWLTQSTIWGFVIFTGGTAAAVRGGIAASLTFWLVHRGHAPPGRLIIAGCLAFTLLLNPFIWQDVGWQLSLAAFGGLIWLGPWLAERAAFKSVAEPLRAPLLETIAASLPTLPLSITQFGILSLTGLVANPLVLWLVPVATFAGLGALVGNWLLPSLYTFWRLGAWAPLHLSLWLIYTLSHLSTTWNV